MKLNKILKYLICLVTLFLYSLQTSFAEGTMQHNILHKVEFSIINEEILTLTLHTTQKYQDIPSPLKKEDTGYVLFLPNTNEELESEPDIINLNDFIHKIDIKFFPLQGESKGYTKIFIKTSDKITDLLVKNNVVALKKIKPAEIIEQVSIKENTDTQGEQAVEQKSQTINNEEKPTVEEKIIPTEINIKQESQATKQETPQAEKCERVVKQQLPEKIIETKIVKEADYTPVIYIAILLLILNVLYFVFRPKEKKYEGNLSAELAKKTAGFSKDDYVLLFTDDESLINSAFNYCSQHKINLAAATDNAKNMQGSCIECDDLKFAILEFKFSEFFNHRLFHRKLQPKPKLVVFDVEPKYTNILLKDEFDFINVKKYIDFNFANLFFILSLLLEDQKNAEMDIIFTDRGIKTKNLNVDSYTKKILSSTHKAISDFINRIKVTGRNQKQQIFYYYNDIKY